MFKTTRDAELRPKRHLPLNDVQFWSYVEIEAAWPWFYLQLAEDKGDSIFRTMAMVANLSYLELAVGAQSNYGWIERALIVTPSHLNGSASWRMEPLNQAISIRDADGREQAQQFVTDHGGTYTLGAQLGESALTSHLVFSADTHLRAC